MSPVAAQLMSSARTETGRDDWNTDPASLDRVRRVGRIDLDPCSNPTSTVGAVVSLSLENGDDGLAANWSGYVQPGGLVFVNNPYSQQRAWNRKVIEEARRECPIVMLVPARTDTRAWHELMPVACVLAFWKGRIRFWQNGKPAVVWSKAKGGYVPASAPFPSAFIGINVPIAPFITAFSDVAQVVCP